MTQLMHGVLLFVLSSYAAFVTASGGVAPPQAISSFIQHSFVSNQVLETSFSVFLVPATEKSAGPSSETHSVTDIPTLFPAQEELLLSSRTITEAEKDVLSDLNDNYDFSLLERTRICEYLGWDTKVALHALKAAHGNVTAALVSLEHSARGYKHAAPATVTAATYKGHFAAEINTSNPSAAHDAVISDSATTVSPSLHMPIPVLTKKSLGETTLPASITTTTVTTNAIALEGDVSGAVTDSAPSLPNIVDKNTATINKSTRNIATATRVTTPSSNNNNKILRSRGIYDLTALCDLQSLAMDSAVPVLVQLHASWCGPCRQLTPLLEDLVSSLNLNMPAVGQQSRTAREAEIKPDVKMENVSGVSKGEHSQEVVRLVKVDVDAAATRALVARSVLNVQQLPTLLLLHRGQVLKRLVGFPPAAEIASLVSLITSAISSKNCDQSLINTSSKSLASLSRNLAEFAGLHSLTFGQRGNIKHRVEEVLASAVGRAKASDIDKGSNRDGIRSRKQIALALQCIQNVTVNVHCQERRVVRVSNAQYAPLFASPSTSPGDTPGQTRTRTDLQINERHGLGLALLAVAGFAAPASHITTTIVSSGGDEARGVSDMISMGCAELTHYNVAILNLVKQTISEALVRIKFAANITPLQSSRRLAQPSTIAKHIQVKPTSPSRSEVDTTTAMSGASADREMTDPDINKTNKNTGGGANSSTRRRRTKGRIRMLSPIGPRKNAHKIENKKSASVKRPALIPPAEIKGTTVALSNRRKAIMNNKQKIQLHTKESNGYVNVQKLKKI